MSDIITDEPINEFAVLKRLDDLRDRLEALTVKVETECANGAATDDMFAEVRKIKANVDAMGSGFQNRMMALEGTDDPEYDTDDMPAVSKRMAAAANRAYKSAYGETHERGRFKLAIQAALVQQRRREE